MTPLPLGPSDQDASVIGAVPEAQASVKSRKACVNCRRQKVRIAMLNNPFFATRSDQIGQMKCRIDQGPSCRRCLRTGVSCVFVPRANAAAYTEGYTPGDASHRNERSSQLNESILRRLQRLEDHVGLNALGENGRHNETQSGTMLESPEPEDSSLRPLRPAIQVLKNTCSAGTTSLLWEEPLIKRLWLSFHDTMLGLHFLPTKQTFSSPTPLMLAAMLYCSSMRGSDEVVVHAAEYFIVLCNAIAQLCMPSSEIGKVPKDPSAAEEWAFQTILGIILAGLLREGVSKETGIWISVAYRLILEHCPPHMDEKSLEWQRLFTGLQIVDLEHASIHLSCPVIPVIAPFPRLRIAQQDQLYRLSRMMHTGLTHFTGRGLPTIWACFTSDTPTTSDSSSFSGVDAAVIRDWARQLDDWLVEFGARNEEADNQSKLTFRQYVLHRLLVLSIYLPARGSDLFSNTTPKEQHELLVSARAAVKLQVADSSIWSNFDLVMITWAALIVIQGVDGGVGEPDDLENVRVHLGRLREAHEHNSNLHGFLADRLETKLQGLSTPQMGDAMSFEPDGTFDTSWYIFNQSSLDAGFDMSFLDGPLQ